MADVAKEQRRKSPAKRWLTIAGAGIGILLLAEVALRLYVYVIGGPVVALARLSPAASFVFVSDDPWQFDPRHGFVGRPGLRYLMGSASGLSGSCSDAPSSLWPASDLGPAWRAAELRLGVFGAEDAGFQPEWNRRPWPTLLAAELSRLSGRRIAIANYSRPSVGIVQSLVLAAEMAPTNGIDLVVLAPTTATLALDFAYRAVLPTEGALLPLASTSARLIDQPTLGRPVGPIVNPRVTKSWCNQLQTAARTGMTALLRFDGLLKELQDQANVSALLARKPVAANWLSPRPALLQSLRQRKPIFAGVKDVPPSPPTHLSDPDLAHDDRVTAALAALHGAGISVVVLQSPLFPELLERRVLLNYAGAPQQQLDRLLASVARLTRRPVLRMIDVLDRDVASEAPDLVNNPANDWQLRVGGTELYADLAARALQPVVTTLRRGR